jgi:hypothetical protein
MEKINAEKKFVVKKIMGFSTKLEIGVSNGDGIIRAMGTIFPKNDEASECFIALFQEMATSRGMLFYIENWEE